MQLKLLIKCTRVREGRILALTAGKNVVRFLPPLTLGEEDLEDAVDMLSDAFDCMFGE